jgi:hypothetical protein
VTPEEILESLRDNYPECLVADGFEGALVGVVDGACREPVACYDYEKCVEIFMAKGMSEEDAHEWMSFNVLGAYCGEYTPLFLHDWRKETDLDIEVELELDEVEGLREQLLKEQRQEPEAETKRGQE